MAPSTLLTLALLLAVPGRAALNSPGNSARGTGYPVQGTFHFETLEEPLLLNERQALDGSALNTAQPSTDLSLTIETIASQENVPKPKAALPDAASENLLPQADATLPPGEKTTAGTAPTTPGDKPAALTTLRQTAKGVEDAAGGSGAAPGGGVAKVVGKAFDRSHGPEMADAEALYRLRADSPEPPNPETEEQERELTEKIWFKRYGPQPPASETETAPAPTAKPPAAAPRTPAPKKSRKKSSRTPIIDYAVFGRELARYHGRVSLNPLHDTAAKRSILRAAGYTHLLGPGGERIPLSNAGAARIGKAFQNALNGYQRWFEETGE